MAVRTLEGINDLTNVGFNEKQAKAMVTYIEKAANSNQSEVVSRLEFKSELKGLENTLIKWMIGTTVATLLLVFTVMEFRFKAMEQRMTSMEQRMTTMEQRMTSMERVLDQNTQGLEHIQTSVQQLLELHLEESQSR